MSSPIDDGRVLITGASSGIGRELALRIAHRAKAILLVARRRERLDELAAELTKLRPALEVRVFACDVTDRAATDAMLAEAGTVDVLVNNAGLGDLGVFDRANWEKTERMIALNCTSLLYLTHRLVGAMVGRGRGGILNISSGFGLTFGPGMAAYIATKHFVSGFTEGLRLDVAGTGVVVTQVCPGPVATEFEENIGNFTGLHAPKFVEISAAACARASIRGFDWRRALVIPGFWIKVLLFLGLWTPRVILRLLYAPAARALRRKQLAASK